MKPVIKKIFNLKFENVSFTKPQKNINEKPKKICFGLHTQENRVGR